MPTLRQVLCNREFKGLDSFLDSEVLAVKLSVGAPCFSHSGLFETWPGSGENVHQWFVLANGKAVGISEGANGKTKFPVIDYCLNKEKL